MVKFIGKVDCKELGNQYQSKLRSKTITYYEINAVVNIFHSKLRLLAMKNCSLILDSMLCSSPCCL